jgi:hypothetical protein
MPDELLASPKVYEAFIYTLRERHPSILRSSLKYIPSGTSFGRVEGIVLFEDQIVLCIQEFLNFELRIIEGYGYEVSRAGISLEDESLPETTVYCKASYPHKEKLYWYDSFPHPNDASLASTDPHHKHVSPDIKHNRIPAPDLSFTRLNLPFLIREIEETLLSRPTAA